MPQNPSPDSQARSYAHQEKRSCRRRHCHRIRLQRKFHPIRIRVIGLNLVSVAFVDCLNSDVMSSAEKMTPRLWRTSLLIRGACLVPFHSILTVAGRSRMVSPSSSSSNAPASSSARLPWVSWLRYRAAIESPRPSSATRVGDVTNG